MTSPSGHSSRGLLVIVSAPAGTGKTTLVNRLIEEFPNLIRSVSYTTRAPRKGEIPGRDYYFVTEEEFKEGIERGDFLEYVKLYGNFYGTSRNWVEKKQEEGYHVVLVIDTQGASKLMDSKGIFSIFITPPSLEVLKERLIKRATDSEASIARRLKWAEQEMDHSAYYDYLVVNDDLETAFNTLKCIVSKETDFK